MSKKVVVLLSGGMDSTTLLHHHLNQKDQVRAIAFDYGQRHSKELYFAQLMAAKLGVPIAVVNLSPLKDVLPGSSQTDASVPVPEGHYEEESMKLTVVPNRNMILLSIAIGHAIAYKMDQVSYAAHAGDHAVYPDCRPEFAAIIARAAQQCDWRKIELVTPFIHKTKADIAKEGVELKVPFQDTWSCYKGGALHCGVCGTCIERREAFHKIAAQDPTIYMSSAPSVETLVANGWKLPKAA